MPQRPRWEASLRQSFPVTLLGSNNICSCSKSSGGSLLHRGGWETGGGTAQVSSSDAWNLRISTYLVSKPCLSPEAERTEGALSMPDVEMWNQLATAIIHILPTLRDVLELQALVCSGPSEVEELARPAHASPVRLFIGDSPLQGAGSVVQEVDAQLQVCLPWHQWGAEHGQLQPLAGCLAQGGLQNAGVETAEGEGGRDLHIGTRKA